MIDLRARITFARLPEIPPNEIIAHMSDHRVAQHMPLLTFAWDSQTLAEFVSAKEERWRRDGLGQAWALGHPCERCLCRMGWISEGGRRMGFRLGAEATMLRARWADHQKRTRIRQSRRENSLRDISSATLAQEPGGTCPARRELRGRGRVQRRSILEIPPRHEVGGT